MSPEEKERFIKVEKSVEDIKTDVSVIKSALLGNELSGDRGLVGQITVLKAELELLKQEVTELTEEKIKNSILIKIITWLSVVIGTGVIGFVLREVFPKN